MNRPTFNLRRIDALLWALIIMQTVVVFAATDPVTGDTPKYFELARSINDGRYGTTRDGTYYPDAVRPPGYPLMLWLLTHALPLPLAGVLAIQMVLYLASVYLLYRLLVGHEIAATPFLLLTAAYPFTAAYAARFMTEGATTFLVALAVYSLSLRRSLRTASVVLVGACLGAAILFRSDLLFLPLALAVPLYLRQRGARLPTGVALAHAALLVAVAVAALLPYAWRNLRTFGSFSPLPPAGAVGNSLWTATWESQITPEDVLRLNSNEITENLRASGFLANLEQINAEIGAPPHTVPFNPESYGPSPDAEIRATRLFAREARRRIFDSPFTYAAHVVTGWWRLWNTAEYPAAIPPLAATLLKIGAGMIAACGLAGGFLLLFSRDARWRFAAATLLYFPLIHCWLHTEARYTASARPLLVLTASLLVIRAAERVPAFRTFAPARRRS